MIDRQINIAIFEDNAALRKSLENLFASVPAFNILGSFPNPLKIIEFCTSANPDVIIMDIEMPRMTGIEALKLIIPKFPHIKVIMLTVFDEDEKVFHAICSGASGYLLKQTNPDLIIESIIDVYRGGAPMSPVIASKILHMFRSQNIVPAEEFNLSVRETEILRQLSKGLSYKMIASECNISIDTVRFYIKKIYEKLHVHSMSEAVSKAIQNRLV